MPLINKVGGGSSKKHIGSVLICTPNETFARGGFSKSFYIRQIITTKVGFDYSNNISFTNDEVKSYISVNENDATVTGYIQSLKMLKDCTVVIHKHQILTESNSPTQSYIKHVIWQFGSTEKYHNDVRYYGLSSHSSSLDYLYMTYVNEQKASVKSGDVIRGSIEAYESLVSQNSGESASLNLGFAIVIDIYE